MDYITITGLRFFAHHGVYEQETVQGQEFVINAKLFLDMETAGQTDELETSVHYGLVSEFIVKFLTEHTYKLLEMAVTQVGRAILLQFPLLQAVELEMCKPNAPIELVFENISVTRNIAWHKAYIALGSNMGDTKGYIEGALSAMEADAGFRSIRSSQLIVTKPYGGVEQDDFLNGVVEVETYYTPNSLLHVLHDIENEAQRKREIHWGPRTLDLDILFYDNLIMDSKELTIPHIDLANRDFVLRPMCELAPYFRHPILLKTMQQLLDELLQR